VKQIHFSLHASQRLTEHRQRGIGRRDIIRACFLAKEILFRPVPEPLELKNFMAQSGRRFNIVVVDEKDYLKIITIIGTSKGKWKDKKNWRNRKGKMKNAFQ